MRNLFFMLIIVTSFAFAETAPAARTTEQPSLSASSSTSAPLSRISLGPSLYVAGGVAPGFNFEAVFRVGDVPFYLGLETGLLIASGGGVTALFIPILMTGYYRFNVAGSKVHPLLGLSMGFAVVTASGAISGSGVGFQALFRPGIEIETSGTTSISIEPKLGILGSSFIFNPQVNFMFAM